MDPDLTSRLLKAMNVNIIGMGVVFLLLELLADLMRVVTRIFPERPGETEEDVVPTPRLFKAAANVATQLATQVVKPIQAASEAATYMARPISEAQERVPYRVVVAAAIHHYRRSRRGSQVNLHEIADSRWCH